MVDSPEHYRLPAHENERIFRERILVVTGIVDLPSQPQPKARFLVGQPGAGKTRLAELLGRDLDERGGYVVVDSDLYKPFHPSYDELMSESDQLMAAHTGPDGQAWTHKVQTYAREQRLDVLVHETVQNPPYFAEQLREYRAAGYRVEVAVVGVAESVSHQGILHRYYQQVADRGHGRLSVPEKAAASYSGIVEAARVVDEQQLADEVAVFRRSDEQPRYDNQLDEHGQWQHPPRLVEAIETERTRPLDPTEREQFQLTQAHLRQVAEPERHAELDAIETAAEPILAAATPTGQVDEPPQEIQRSDVEVEVSPPVPVAERQDPEPPAEPTADPQVSAAAPVVQQDLDTPAPDEPPAPSAQRWRVSLTEITRRLDQHRVAEEEAAHSRERYYQREEERQREREARSHERGADHDELT